MNPSTRPASTSHGAVPATIAAVLCASRRSAWPRVNRPGSTNDQPRRIPAAAGDDDARQLEHPVPRDERDEHLAVPGADR